MSTPTTSSNGVSANCLLGTILAGLAVLAILLGGIVAKTYHPPQSSHADNDSALLERIKPVGEVVVAAADSTAAPGAAKSGEQIVTQTCSACHGTGVMGSPKLGDKAAWAPRIAQGYETLVKHAIAGIRSMPARGGDAALTDAEVAAAVAHMANAAGASFKAPSK